MPATAWNPSAARAQQLQTLLDHLDDRRHLSTVVDQLDRLYPVLEEQLLSERDPSGEHEGVDPAAPGLRRRGRELLAEHPRLLRAVIDARQHVLACNRSLSDLGRAIRDHEHREAELRRRGA